MRLAISIAAVLAFTCNVSEAFVSYSTTQGKQSSTLVALNEHSRRDMVQKAGKAFVVATSLAISNGVSPAGAVLAPCPKNSKNCLHTVWTPPSNVSRQQAIAMLRQTLNEYPQEGQQKADMGGYKIVSDDLEGPTSLARVEYTSGIGFFSKTFNGGKPFIDDLELEVDQNGATEVRSSSRVGKSDLGVNKKRVDYLAAALTQKGWLCPSAEYGQQ